MTAHSWSPGTPISGSPSSNGGPTTERSASSAGTGRPRSRSASLSDPVMAGKESVIVPSRSTSTWVRRFTEPLRSLARRLARLTPATVPAGWTGRGSVRGALDRLPHPLGRRRHVDVAHAEVAHGIDDGRLDGWRRPDRPRLADALGAERVDERRRLHRHELEARKLGSTDEGVVGEVRRDRVAVVVVAHLLHQGLGRALGDAAVALAIEEQRVDDRAGVVAGDEA